MPKLIKNYSTEVPTERTIAEITKLLVDNGATGIAFEYDGQGILTGLFFRIVYQGRQLPFRLPARPNEVYQALFAERNREWKYERQWREQATMIAWRICKLWLEAQLTHVNLGQAKLQEVFLPYLVLEDNKTLYERMENNQFLLSSPREAESSQ
jgi:hypothetical protein